MHPLQLTVDGGIACRFLDLLDPDHDQFVFAAGRRQPGARQGQPQGRQAAVDRPSARLDR